MFTSIDKAIVAFVMALVFLINYFFGINLGWVTQDAVAAIVGALTPLLVWAVPNKPKA